MPTTVKPTLAQVIGRHSEKTIQNFCVATPGVIVSYNAGSRTCTVKPGVHRLVPVEGEDELDRVEEYAAIQNVPVCWLVGRGIQVNATLAAGDPVLLIATDRDISAWRRTGQASEPDDARVHTWASCVAIPGLVPNTNPIPAPTDAAALAGAVASEFNTIAAALDTIAAAVPTSNPYTAVGNPVAAIKARIASAILKLGS